MPFNPKVTTIIPVYNGSNFLAEAIDSALAQTYKNIEIIVVNDGSNDNGKTENIAKSYEDRIRYFYKKNGGVASALNLGIKESEGGYISWLSHDDLYLPDKIEKQVQYLRNTSDKKILLFSDFKVLNLTTGHNSICRVKHENSDNLYSTLLILFNATIHGCTLLIPKDAFKEVGLFNEELKTTQDYDMWLKFAKGSYKFVHLPYVLIKTRWHNEQGTILMSDIHKKEVEDFYNGAVDILSEDFNSFSFRQIAFFIAKMRNKLPQNTKSSVLKSWRAGNRVRFLLSFVVR